MHGRRACPKFENSKSHSFISFLSELTEEFVGYDDDDDAYSAHDMALNTLRYSEAAVLNAASAIKAEFLGFGVNLEEFHKAISFLIDDFALELSQNGTGLWRGEGY